MNCGSGAFHGSCRWLLILPSFPGFSPSSRAICTCACERRAACAPQPRPGPEAEEPSVTFPYEPAQPMTIGLDPFRALRRHRQQWIHSAAHLTYPGADCNDTRGQPRTPSAEILSCADIQEHRLVLRPGQLQIMEAGGFAVVRAG